MKLGLSLKYRIALVIFLLEIVMVAMILQQTLTVSMENSRRQEVGKEKATLNLLSTLSRVALLIEEYGELQSYMDQVTQDDSHVV